MLKKHATARQAIAALAILTLAALPLAAENEIIKAEATVSYYGEEFNGKPTSSGEIFDMNALTAAHKTLPFGTLLEITNLDNGRRTKTSNVRGPFERNRGARRFDNRSRRATRHARNGNRSRFGRSKIADDRDPTRRRRQRHSRRQLHRQPFQPACSKRTLP